MRDGCFIGQLESYRLKEESALGYPDKTGFNDGGVLDCSVGVKLGQPEMDGWSVRSYEAAALSVTSSLVQSEITSDQLNPINMIP